MRGPLWRWLVLGSVLLVVTAVAGMIMYLFASDSASEQDHRATVLATVLAAVVIVPAVVVWGWSRVRSPVPGVSTPAQVVDAGDLLASRMFDSWSAQVVRRGIQTPAPVLVSWSWGAPEVALPREDLTTSPALGTDPPPIPTGALGPDGAQVLGAGLVTQLHEQVYSRLRHGRLVLIGGPGAGKTGAMILLLLEALRHRAQLPASERVEVPVPVWLTLGSWDPIRQGLRQWVVATMARDHPYLRAVDFGPDAIGGMFDAGRVALFLDGLDEMSDALRDQAMERLRTEAGGRRVVLTSRPDEYRSTLQAGPGLAYTAVVQLRPVAPETAAAYLLEGQTGSVQNAWRQVTDRLRANPDGVLARTLNTPLTLSLARFAYTGRDPTGMLADDLDTEQALRGHLLDQVLVTAYPDPDDRAHATYWLGWIAHHMNTQPAGPTRDLPWWHIPGWIPWRDLRLGGGVVVGLGVWLVIWLGGGGLTGDGLTGGFLVLGLVLGLAVGFMFERGHWFGDGPPIPHVVIFRWPTRRELLSMLVGELGGGLMIGLLLGFADEIGVGHAAGLVVGIAGALMFGLMFGLLKVWRLPVATSADATPHSVYREDVQAQLMSGLMSGFVVVFGFALIGALGPGLAFGLTSGLTFGLALGLVFALGFESSASPRLLTTEVALRLRGRRVWFMSLLETAMDRQVLRQAGAVCQFRHAALQDRLADQFTRDHLTAT